MQAIVITRVCWLVRSFRSVRSLRFHGKVQLRLSWDLAQMTYSAAWFEIYSPSLSIRQIYWVTRSNFGVKYDLRYGGLVEVCTLWVPSGLAILLNLYDAESYCRYRNTCSLMTFNDRTFGQDGRTSGSTDDSIYVYTTLFIKCTTNKKIIK